MVRYDKELFDYGHDEDEPTNPVLETYQAYTDGIINYTNVMQNIGERFIQRIFWKLKFYNSDLISPELENAVKIDNLVSTLVHPEEHKDEFLLIIALLKTKQDAEIEELRLQTLDMVLKLCGQSFENLAEVEILLPPAPLLVALQKVIKFYDGFDPNDFKNEELGYGQKKEDAFKKDSNELNFRTVNYDPIFRDMHALTEKEDVPSQKKRELYSLIENLRKYADDPISDKTFVYYIESGKLGMWVNVNTSIKSSDGINGYIAGDKVFKPMGNGVIAVTKKNAVAEQLKKNRVMVNAEGKKLGIARGPIIFFAKDNKDNITTLTEEQARWIQKNYYQIQTFDGDRPVTSDRAQTLLNRLVCILLSDKFGEETMRGAGFTETEIENFKRYLSFKK